MASLKSAGEFIAEAKGQLYTLLQDNDTGSGFAREQWSDQVFEATQRLQEALNHLDNAELS